tara:strand:- start:1561 stop:2640 length:1080 start_codon:yes stop_codon:yes gene_type:complete
MKIDFIISSLTSGGAERVVVNLANFFSEKGHEVRVLTFRKVNDSYSLHSNIRRVRFDKKFFIFNFTSVKCLLFLTAFYFKKENRPDIMSSHATLMGYATIPISKLYNIKITVSEHTNHFRGKNDLNNWFLWNYLYRFPDAITVLTKYDLPFFQKKNQKVIVIHNPCSFTPIENIQLEREKIILAVGNTNRYKIKGFDNLLDVAAVVLPQHQNWKLKIVGEGNKGLLILKEKALKLNIANQVIFSGFQSNVSSLMKESEIFVLSSRFEGLPMALLEAMSQGMACIAYDCISGPSEIIINDVNGILVENQNKNNLGDSLNKLINDEKLRMSLRENAINSLEKFSIQNIGSTWENLFQELLK